MQTIIHLRNQKNVDEVVNSVELASSLIFNWFGNIGTKGDASKSTILLSTGELVGIKEGDTVIQNSTHEKF